MIHVTETDGDIIFTSPMYFDRTEKVKRSLNELNVEELRDFTKYMLIGFEKVHGNLERAHEIVKKADEDTAQLLGWSEELEQQPS